jgi:probable F420-dependent oxidoreductase
MSEPQATSTEPVRHWQALHFADPQELLALGQEAERLGFTGIALGDHLVLPVEWQSPYPYTPDGRVAMSPLVDFPDPWVSFAAIAMQTTRLKFATWVYILPLRDVFTVAKSVATLDRLAPGRTLFGIGVGWLAEEFRAAGLDFTTRGRRTDEMLEALERLWTGGPVSFHGEHLDFDDVYLRPVPAQPVPICVGGHTRVALQRAARHDGWFALAVDRAGLLSQLQTLQGIRKELGREGAPFTVMTMLGADADHAECEELVRLGVTDIVFQPPVSVPDLAGKLAALRGTMARHPSTSR